MNVYEINEKLPSTGNATKNIDRYVEGVREYFDISEEAFYQIVLCLVEAVNNAAEHGNSFNPDKHVHISIKADDEKLVMKVRDEGTGFNPDFEAAEARINSEINKFATRGRGLFLIKKLMHQVDVDTSNGTELTMTYFFDREPLLG
jgi:serine/threonine-protein kinase RsbW